MVGMFLGRVKIENFLSDNYFSVDSGPLWFIIVGLALSWFIPIAFNINVFSHILILITITFKH